MSLPIELLLAILESVEKSDLKSVRLVSKTWSSCASIHLFDHLYVSANKKDLDVFNAVVTHPSLGGFVRNLTYDGTWFVPYFTKKDYVMELRRQIPTCTIREGRTACSHPDPDIQELLHHSGPPDYAMFAKFKKYIVVNAGYRNYKKHASYQQKLIKSGEFRDMLGCGLEKLSSLQSVALIGCWPRLGLPYERRTGSPLVRSWDNFYCAPQSWEWELPTLKKCADGAFHYKLLVGALVDAHRPIGIFKMGNRFSPGLPSYVFEGGKHTFMGHPRLDLTAFTKLKSLSLSLAAFGEGAQMGSENDRVATCDLFPNLSGLISLLESTTDLVSLELKLPEHLEEPPKFFEYPHVFPKLVQWNILNVLALENLAITANDLIDLITKGMPNLKRLKLHEISLITGTWESVFQSLREMQSPPALEFHDDAYLFNCGGEDFWPEHCSESLYQDLINYVKDGGRHPCLPEGEPDSAAVHLFRL